MEIVLQQPLDILEESENFNLIYEQVLNSFKFPRTLKSKTIRRKIYEECGSKAFLDPDKLQFPIYETTKCDKPSCQLLLASFCYLKQINRPGNRDLINKAKELIRENKCNGINIRFENMEESITLEDLLYYLDDEKG